jgi:predicted nucleic acid-binding protein
MKPVFADAFYYVALLNRGDVYHQRAVEISRHFRGPIVTTTWVLVEVADAFAGSASRQRIMPFIQALEDDPDTNILSASMALFNRGLRLYSERTDKDWTLTDCISFEAMREEGITEALTGDRHYEQAGFKALLV